MVSPRIPVAATLTGSFCFLTLDHDHGQNGHSVSQPVPVRVLVREPLEVHLRLRLVFSTRMISHSPV